MDAIVSTQELNKLLSTVNELTEDSITFWHQTLANRVRVSVSDIEKLAVAANQESLVQELTQVFDRHEKDILETLELPLKSLRGLVESGHLSEFQKARLLIQLGKTYDLLAQWDEALDQFYHALDYSQNSLPEKAEILKYIGHIKSKQRDHNAAESLYRESLTFYSKLQNQHELAHIYLCLGFNAFETQNHQRAEENYKKALAISTHLEGAEQIIGEANLTVGILATVKGNFQDALAHYQQSVGGFESIRDERGLSEAYYNMGMLYVDMKQFAEAGQSYQKALDYARKYSDLHLIGYIHLSQTELALNLSDLALAQAYCIQAVKVLASRLGSEAQLSEAYKYAGQIHHRKQSWSKAERFFQKSIQKAEESGSRLNKAEAHYEYGLMLLDKQDQNAAKTHLDYALDIFTELGAHNDVLKIQKAESSRRLPIIRRPSRREERD